MGHLLILTVSNISTVVSQMSSEHNDIAVYGMGVMGANLAMNIASRGFQVAIGNRSEERLSLAAKQAEEEQV
jgi:6-phosphogluconate dehydrogenase